MVYIYTLSGTHRPGAVKLSPETGPSRPVQFRTITAVLQLPNGRKAL